LSEKREQSRHYRPICGTRRTYGALPYFSRRVNKGAKPRFACLKNSNGISSGPRVEKFSGDYRQKSVETMAYIPLLYHLTTEKPDIVEIFHPAVQYDEFHHGSKLLCDTESKEMY
jgi:hypothetical protein